MREYELIIDKALKAGLTPVDIIPTNTQILSECFGYRCGKAGLERYKALSNPIPNTVDLYYNWPFPQFITGERYNFLIVRDSVTNQEDVVYLLSDDHLTVTHIFSIDELTFGKGDLMEVADFGEYAFMTNGVVMIYWDTTLSAWQVITASATIPMMKTVCNFKGQAIGGNVISAWHDCDEKFYVWSKIGSMDFTIDEDNEAGYRRCPFGGEVYHVRRLGDHVIGYSSKGIVQLTAVNAPASTFGFKELHDLGLINKGAMNGNLREHVFVDSDYNVWKIGAEVKKLGYDRYMKRLAGEDIIVNYDPANGDFYIGNSEKAFLLSNSGLTEITQFPSAVWRRGNETYMLPDTESTERPYICSELFDMEYKGQKTISTIETDVSQVEGAEAGIDYINDLNTWHTEIYKPINNQGIATNAVSGNMFRFRLRFSDVYNDMRISYIKARYKMTDLRGIRGVYAPGLRGQSRGE